MSIVTDDIFSSYLLCKYKAFLKYWGESGTISEYEQYEREALARYKRQARGILLRKEKGILAQRYTTNEDLKKGDPLLLNLTIQHADLQARFDCLEKSPGKSALGSFFYIPVAFFLVLFLKNAITFLLFPVRVPDSFGGRVNLFQAGSVDIICWSLHPPSFLSFSGSSSECVPRLSLEKWRTLITSAC
jgi:hypothetical protein